MFDVYIRYFKRADGTVDTGGWQKMFGVPLSDGNGAPVNNPSVKGSEDSADSFDFTMEPGSPYYDSFVQLVTLVRVEYSGASIFYGRTLTVNASTVYQTRNVHCEGSFAFLNDTYYEGLPDKSRKEISWSTYFDKLIDNHNDMVGDSSYKKIRKGTIGFTPDSEKKKFEPSGWSQTSALFNSLKDELGGHMLTRFDASNNRVYLDWYKYYKRDLGDGNRPVVEVGRNILDLTSNSEVDNVFTRVIPIGKTDNDGNRTYIDGYEYTDIKTGGTATNSSKAMPVNLLPHLYSDLNDEFHSEEDYAKAEEHYGVIYKTIEFGDADTKEKLWNECKKWIKQSFYGAVTSFEIRAIDMHLTNTNLNMILLGDCVDVYYKILENGQVVRKYKKLVCKSVKYDLFNPENNTYTFGIPSDLLKISKSAQESKSSSSKKKTASREASSPPSKSDDPPDTNLTFDKIIDIIREDPDIEHGYGGSKTSTDPTVSAADSFKDNGRLTGTVQCYDSSWHYDPYGHPEGNITAQVVGKITLPGRPTKWIAFNNSNGLFAYLCSTMPSELDGDPVVVGIIGDTKTVHEITHWYIKQAGYSYDAPTERSYSQKLQVAQILGGPDATPEITMFGDGGKLAARMLVMGKDGHGGLATLAADGMNGILSIIDPDKAAQTTKDKLRIRLSGKTGEVDASFAAYGKGFGPVDEKFLATIKQDGTTGTTKYINPAKAGSDDNTDIQAKISAAKGEVDSILQGVGKKFDINGNLLTTIVNKGEEAITEMFPPEKAGSTNKKDKTVEINAAAENKDEDDETTSTGQLKVGKDLRNGSTTNFKITMNDAFTYSAYKYNDRTKEWYYEDEYADGFMSASDFHLPEIPSYKTKIAVIDKLWADQATVNNLTVNNDAWIKDLTGETAKIPKISAFSMRCNNLSSSGGHGYSGDVSAANNVYAGGTFYLRGDGSGNDVNVGSCFIGGSMNSSTGVLTLTRANGSTPATFNMADMAWHKNAVSAAKITGANSVYGSGYSSKINPGGNTTITLYYPHPSTGVPTATGQSYTISANPSPVPGTPYIANTDGTQVTSPITSNMTIMPRVSYNGSIISGSNISIDVPSPTINKVYILNSEYGTEISSEITSNINIYSKAIMSNGTVGTGPEISVNVPTVSKAYIATTKGEEITKDITKNQTIMSRALLTNGAVISGANIKINVSGSGSDVDYVECTSPSGYDDGKGHKNTNGSGGGGYFGNSDTTCGIVVKVELFDKNDKSLGTYGDYLLSSPRAIWSAASSGGGGSHSISVSGLIGPMSTEKAIKAELPSSTTKVSPSDKGKWYGVEVACGSAKKGIYWKTPT